MKRVIDMLCKKCGQYIPDGVYYCEHCGEPVENTYTQQPFQSGDSGYTRQTYQQPNAQYNPYAQQYTPEAYEYMISSKIEDARTMGILAIILGLFFPILGIIFGCIGISKINEIPPSNQYSYNSELNKKKAKNLCIAGIVLPIVLWVLAVIFIFLFFTLMAVSYDQLASSFMIYR